MADPANSFNANDRHLAPKCCRRREINFFCKIDKTDLSRLDED